MSTASHRPFTVSTTPERVALARRTHRRVDRTLSITMGGVAAVILLAGIPLSLRGSASLPGVLIVAAAFLVLAVLMVGFSTRTLRNAERFLAADGVTYFSVGAAGLMIGDTEVPYERITCMFAHVEGEQYSSGGARGEAMAYRMELSEDRPGPGRAIGRAVGTSQRRQLYREGAKSTISLAIGVDRKSEIRAPEGLIDGLRALPKRGEDPGRIDVPFGAYFGVGELRGLFRAVREAIGGTAFPIAIVSGALNWAQATAAACESREKIWEELPSIAAQT